MYFIICRWEGRVAGNVARGLDVATRLALGAARRVPAPPALHLAQAPRSWPATPSAGASDASDAAAV